MLGHTPVTYMVQQSPPFPPSHTGGSTADEGAAGPPPGGDRNTSDYLAQLLNDKRLLQVFPNVFQHMEMILDEGAIAHIN